MVPCALGSVRVYADDILVGVVSVTEFVDLSFNCIFAEFVEFEEIVKLPFVVP